MLQVAYFGGLRVSELVSLTWHQVIRRDSGEAQLSIVGKGNKDRQVLIPAAIAGPLFASRGDSPASAPVFSSVRRPGQPLTERAVNYIIKDAAERAGVNHAASVHLAAARTRQSRDRQWCANHPRVGDARTHRPQDDVGIRMLGRAKVLVGISRRSK